MRVFAVSIRHNSALVEFIDNISGGNMRVALDMVRNFFGSGHVDTRKILEIFENTGSYHVPLHEFQRAVIYGDTAHYDPSRSPIVNMFDIGTPSSNEHFLLPMLVTSVFTLADSDTGIGYVSTAAVTQHLQDRGFTPDQIARAIERSTSYKLVEHTPGRFTGGDSNHMTALRATSIGLYHIHKLCYAFAYLDAVVVDTPILDRSIREAIHDVHTIEERVARAELFLDYLDSSWLRLTTAGEAFDWPSICKSQRKEIDQIRDRLELRRERLDYEADLARRTNGDGGQ
jgi:hypothetical protein